MLNKEIAQQLDKIADYLEMEEIDYKPFAYRRASSSISELSEDIEEIYEEKGREGIEEINGVGKNIADKIEEFILTGEMEYLENLKAKFPVDLDNLLRVEGLGPKSIKKLFKELNVRNLSDLEKATKEGEIASLSGFGEKTEKNIREAIEFLKKDEGKWLLGEVFSDSEAIFSRLEKLKETEKISFAGSLRRKKETVGDVDILVSAKKAEEIIDCFVGYEGVLKTLSKGETRSSIRLKSGFNVDLRVVGKNSFGSALQYFTGSKEHNIKLRRIANEKGMKLNEYGLFKDGRRVAGREEEKIYSLLGLSFVPPELREDRGEVEAYLKGEELELVTQKDIKGELHMHTTWTGGAQTVEEMAKRGEELGYEYIGIADHTEFLRIENGLNAEDLEKQRAEIKEVDAMMKIKIFQGCEANILKDGSLDIDDEALEKLDYVIAGIHSNFKMDREEMTARVVKAIKHPLVKIISHPTGRLIKRRESLDLDMVAIFNEAKKAGVVLEINSSPHRLDLRDTDIKRCVEMNIPMIINSDAHHVDQLENISFGIGQARRGWAEKKNIINSKSKEELKKFFKSDEN